MHEMHEGYLVPRVFVQALSTDPAKDSGRAAADRRRPIDRKAIGTPRSRARASTTERHEHDVRNPLDGTRKCLSVLLGLAELGIGNPRVALSQRKRCARACARASWNCAARRTHAANVTRPHLQMTQGSGCGDRAAKGLL